MTCKKDTRSCSAEEKKTMVDNALRDLPGAAVDTADHEKDDRCLEKQRTRTLNNNPRNNDNRMPG